MRKEIADMWADELESGKHEQCIGNLVTGDERVCALGVLGKVWARETGNEFTVNTHSAWAEVVAWADLSSMEPWIDGDPIPFLNDTEKWELKQFADPIREQWEEL